MNKILDIPTSILDTLATQVSSHVPQNAKFFITGGTGIVGKWLLATLTQLKLTSHSKIQVVILTRDPNKLHQIYPECRWVEFICGDVREQINHPLQDFDYFLHGATDVLVENSYNQMLDVNINGTRNALNFAAKTNVKSFHLISSGAIYGQSNCPRTGYTEETTPQINHLNQKSAYAIGKMISESMVLNFKPNKPMKMTASRLFANYGHHLPLSSHFAISNFARDVIQDNDHIHIKGDGKSIRSYLHLSDVARALLNILLAPDHERAIYNIGSPNPISISKLAELVSQVSSKKLDLKLGGENTINTHNDIYYPNVDKYQNRFGNIIHLPFEEGLLNYMEWAREHDA